ncbi:MAG: hypothetical protein KAQ68_03720 [Clostridiales bacterium]|nr:hypothetical protein [Clostridiales bacterium]
MKLFGAVFWAVILIVIGIVIILNQTFDWSVSVFAIVFGVILIFLGISVLTRPTNTGINGVFANGSIQSLNKNDNSFIFSNVTVTLDGYEDDNLEVNSIFSNVKIHTNGKSVIVKSSGAFSSTVFPDRSVLSFGDRMYERDGENTIHIKTSCVFGSITIE